MDSKHNVQLQQWPSRAVVTAGMPYGNKPLHFGHIAGVFVPADCFARFLRDRIGKQNVRFVCGTDCFGSPIDEGYRKRVSEQGFSGSIADYVAENHASQAKTLEKYDISLSIFEGSHIGRSGEIHTQVTSKVIQRLYEQGYLHKRSSLQFFDEKAGVFLNGRQVVGRCPVQGCKSEQAYADECSLGHSYDPTDLIAPKSTLSGLTPVMKPVENWYFDLPAFQGFLRSRMKELESDSNIRALVPGICSEFLAPPIIYVKNDEVEQFEALAPQLPKHTQRTPEKGKASFEVEFSSFDDRDEACSKLREAGLRIRTGKTLVPFRITGNIEWGVPAPVIEGLEGLTTWCWPESLWAPVSFTMACEAYDAHPEDSWREYWCSDEAEIYQFIGQDNLYFYGVVQPALWEALSQEGIALPKEGSKALKQTRLIANYHVLFGDKKASSSGAVKPPTADDLLDHYEAWQLRAHFLALGLDQRSVGFKPKPFMDEEARNDPRVVDPVLKETKLLHNVLNRLARSVFYEAKNNFSGSVPIDTPSSEVLKRAHQALAEYDALMKKVELHSIMTLLDDFIRFANKTWSNGISRAQEQKDDLLHRQVLVDASYLLWITTLLTHPIVPVGCEDICEKFAFDPADFFSWDHDFTSLAELDLSQEHKVCELPPRYDFF